MCRTRWIEYCRICDCRWFCWAYIGIGTNTMLTQLQPIIRWMPYNFIFQLLSMISQKADKNPTALAQHSQTCGISADSELMFTRQHILPFRLTRFIRGCRWHLKAIPCCFSAAAYFRIYYSVSMTIFYSNVNILIRHTNGLGCHKWVYWNPCECKWKSTSSQLKFNYGFVFQFQA